MFLFAGAACEVHSPKPSPFTLHTVAFGDSITEGQNGDAPPGLCGQLLCVDVPHAYPTVLGVMLESSYPESTTSVFNAGLGGEPAVGQGEARLPTVLSAQHPQALLLLDGTNDLLGGQAAAIPNLVDRAEKHDPHGALRWACSTFSSARSCRSGRVERRRRGTAAAFVAQANDAIRPMVTSEGAALVDAYTAFVGHETTYLANDGLHVTPTGQSGARADVLQRDARADCTPSLIGLRHSHAENAEIAEKAISRHT